MAGCVKEQTLRSVGKFAGVIVDLSFQSSVMHITVVTNALRPGPVVDKVGSLPYDPVQYVVLSVVGTTHTVCPRSSGVRVGGCGVEVFNEGAVAPPAPPVVPSVDGSFGKPSTVLFHVELPG